MARADDVKIDNGAAGPEISDNLTQNEAAVYDRQIRLWGIEAQNKLRHSRVLLVGLKGLGAEIAKNLVLCGLNAMTIVDGETTTEDDFHSNYFLPKDALGKERGAASLPGVQALNPLVKLSCAKSVDEVDVAAFSLVVLADQPYPMMREVDEKCRAAGVRFIGCSVYGWIGYALLDFNGHDFLMKKPKAAHCMSIDEEGGGGEKKEGEATGEKEKNVQEATIEEDEFEIKTLSYPSYAEALHPDFHLDQMTRRQRTAIPSSYYPIRALLRMEEQGLLTGEEERDIARLTEVWVQELQRAGQSDDTLTILPDRFEYLFGPQLSATCAIVGGFIGQESIKALTGGKHPFRNLMLYSALDSDARLLEFPLVAARK